MQNAWAPATIECYRAKWECFRVWCCDASLDPYTCPLPRLFEFLDSLLVRGLAPSTIKVYTSAISVHRDEDVEMVLSSPAGKRCSEGLASSQPPVRLAPPSWALSGVLRTLCRPPLSHWLRLMVTPCLCGQPFYWLSA